MPEECARLRPFEPPLVVLCANAQCSNAIKLCAATLGCDEVLHTVQKDPTLPQSVTQLGEFGELRTAGNRSMPWCLPLPQPEGTDDRCTAEHDFCLAIAAPGRPPAARYDVGKPISSALTPSCKMG